jgi:single-stranded DNA-binding protein
MCACASWLAVRRYNVEVYNELARQVAEHAPKGTKLAVTGWLTQNKCAPGG